MLNLLYTNNKHYFFFVFLHRSNLYKGVSSPLPELSTLRVDEVYHDLPSDVAPLITTMAIANNVPLVDSVFGKVQEGSVYSYHCQQRKCQKHVHKQMPLFPLSCHFVITGWDLLPVLLSALNISSST